MRSETTMVAEQCRLREWAAQIRDCQSRPTSMSVVEWCACHGITKANYHYPDDCLFKAFQSRFMRVSSFFCHQRLS